MAFSMLTTLLGSNETSFRRLVPTGRKLSIAKVDLEVPIMPGTFYAAGYNYDSHVF
jgi:hypothetical protein